MFLFYLFCFLIFIALVALVVSLFVPGVPSSAEWRGARPRRDIQRTAAILTAVSLIPLFFAIRVTVDTKNLGVERTFGRPSGYLTNGWHWKLPWQTVTEITNVIQTDTYASDPAHQDQAQKGANANCVHVKIARSSVACVNVSVRWQAKATAIDFLFRNYHSNESITDNLVLRTLQQVLNESFVGYDPLGIDPSGNSTNLPLSSYKTHNDYSDIVTGLMQSRLGKWINVQNVMIPFVNFDPDTQKRINQLQEQVALTRIAQQALITNRAQSAANQALAASVAKDPNVLTARCLDLMQAAINKGYAWPAAVQCFTQNGTSTNVAVPAK